MKKLQHILTSARHAGLEAVIINVHMEIGAAPHGAGTQLSPLYLCHLPSTQTPSVLIVRTMLCIQRYGLGGVWKHFVQQLN